MERTKDEYLRDRVYDIKDIERRLLMRLLGRTAASLRDLGEDVLVVSHDLGITHTAAMRRERVIGFATEVGGRTSHAAIMARSLEIPAVVGLHNVTDIVRQGEVAILDGAMGLLVYKYDQAVLNYYRERKRQHEEFERQLLTFKDYPAVTRDGRKIELHANIEVAGDVASAIAHGAAGIGLFRTESLFLEGGGGRLPSEDEQYEAYRAVVSAMAPSPVVIRTLDVGGDKLAPPGVVGREANPFLGWRGIRYSLSHPDLFMQQLMAVYRASAHGTVRVMFPMVSSLHEVRDAKQVVEAAKQELRARGQPFDPNVAIGVMVETPAAATIADSARAGSRLHERRFERPHPVLAGRGPGQRPRRVPVRPVPPGRAPAHRADRPGREEAPGSGSACAERWPATRSRCSCSSGSGSISSRRAR